MHFSFSPSSVSAQTSFGRVYSGNKTGGSSHCRGGSDNGDGFLMLSVCDKVCLCAGWSGAGAC